MLLFLRVYADFGSDAGEHEAAVFLRFFLALPCDFTAPPPSDVYMEPEIASQHTVDNCEI